MESECQARPRQLATQQGISPERIDDVVRLLTWPDWYCFTMEQGGRIVSPFTELPPADVIRGLDFFTSGRTTQTPVVHRDANIRNPLREAAARVGIPSDRVDAAVDHLLRLWEETRLDDQGRVVLDRVPAEGHAIAEQRQTDSGGPHEQAHHVPGAVERAFLDMDYFGNAPRSAVGHELSE